MCGIAGILRTHLAGDVVPPPLEAIPEAWLDVLDDGIKHRGPDGQGRFRDRAVRADGVTVDVALVHRRLSIIDHEGGHQPMVHDGERLRPDLTYQRGETPVIASEAEPDRPLVTVVFNGCIYNHRELRTELEALGHRFETDHSDTEVLVHGWRRYGLYLQDELDGMYAWLAWDRATGQLHISRDRSGEKPIYAAYPLKPYNVHVLSSVYAGLMALLGPIPTTPPRDNLVISGRAGMLDDWMIKGAADKPPQDIVEHLAPGVTASVDEVPVYGEAPEREGTTRIGSGTLREAVISRLEADVPIGVFLSGGIDSGLIAAIAKKHRPDIKAFTVRMPEAAFDESEDAAETARGIGIDHTILDCDATNAADDLVMLTQQLGLPLGDSSLLPTYWVCKAAREHVKVALSGDGGDELFGGYRRHAIHPMLNRWRRVLRLIPDALLSKRRPGGWSTELARLAVAARHSGYEELLSIFPTPELQRLVPMVDGKPTEHAKFRAVDDPLRHDLQHYLPDDLLRKTDTASMAVALEVRSPFLAKDVVESALRTPLDETMPNGERKGLLKNIARQYLPDHVVDRPKRGFAIPIGEWFRTDFGSLRVLLRDHLESSEPYPGLAEAGVEIDMTNVRRLLREHDDAGGRSLNPWKGRDHSQRLYMLLVLSIWCKWLESISSEQSP
ncbi:MAG: asparagine synthase (glutamine-hydrolyzing) [Planctomycetota bacterium]